MSDQSTQRVAIVTGASRGIGRAIATRLAADGRHVVLSARSEGPLNELKAEIEGAGGAATVKAVDISDSSALAAMIDSVAEELGRLDILVNNAGIITRGDITQTSDQDYHRTMAINVEAPFRICRAAIPLMASAGGGAIVNTSSCWGVHPGPNHPLYVMSKAAVASLTQCLGKDHAHQGVRVNAVCPNEVNTPMIRTGFAVRGLDPDLAIDELNKSVPLGRIAEPEDIADVVVFLASSSARYLCGALIEVNGGKSVQ